MKELFDDLYQRLSNDIKFAVSPNSVNLSVEAKDLIDLAIEIWRIDQRLLKAADCLPDNQKAGLHNSLQKLKRYVAKYDIETLDHTGQKYNGGLNFDILSIEQDPETPFASVKETIEPTVMCKGQVIKKAKVIIVSS